MFRIWSIWEVRNYIKLYLSVQLSELHQMIQPPNHAYVKYSKDLLSPEEPSKAAKQFFQEAYQKAISGAHSVQEGKTDLLFDYLSAFEDSNERIQKTKTPPEPLHF